jgi:hypothetical protein
LEEREREASVDARRVHTSQCCVGIYYRKNGKAMTCKSKEITDPHSLLTFCERHVHRKWNWVTDELYGKDKSRSYSELFLTIVMSWADEVTGSGATVTS